MTGATWRGPAKYNGRPCMVTGVWCGYRTVRVVGEDFLRCVVPGDMLEPAGESTKTGGDEGRRSPNGQ